MSLKKIYVVESPVVFGSGSIPLKVVLLSELVQFSTFILQLVIQLLHNDTQLLKGNDDSKHIYIHVYQHATKTILMRKKKTGSRVHLGNHKRCFRN